ncbi:MAG: hypothetical protein IJX94_00850 [Clostridia bacterium]|nr:hypothetical protein [Clostridia bacterium]
MVITFFGHVDFMGTKEHEEYVLALLRRLARKDPMHFFLGGHGSFDEFAYDCCKKFQEEHERSFLWLVSPYPPNQYSPIHMKLLKEKYDGIMHPPLEGVPLPKALKQRNRWMIDRSHFSFAYVEREFGDAYEAYQYARETGRPILNLAHLAVPRPSGEEPPSRP